MQIELSQDDSVTIITPTHVIIARVTFVRERDDEIELPTGPVVGIEEDGACER